MERTITVEQAREICKTGQGAECCCFLGLDVKGFVCMKYDETPAQTLQDKKPRRETMHQCLEHRALRQISVAQSLGGKFNGHKGCIWDNKQEE